MKKIIKNSFIFISYFLYSVLLVLVLNLFNIDINKLDKIGKIIYMFLGDLIYLLFIIFIYKDELIEDLKSFKTNGIKLIFKFFPIYLLGIFLMGLSNMIITNYTGIELSKNEEIIRKLIKLFPIYMIFSSSIYAPIVEELVFRKSIKNIFNNNFVFILMSGTLFGCIHVVGGNSPIIMSIPYIIMGIDLAYIYYKSKNIFTTISIHSIHNTILLLIQLIGG